MIEDGINVGKYDWIWWMDFDALITNTSIKITDIVDDALRNHTDPDSIDMILTPDWYDLTVIEHKPILKPFLLF
jgi:mannan polymerase II complex MNN10 subunit